MRDDNRTTRGEPAPEGPLTDVCPSLQGKPATPAPQRSGERLGPFLIEGVLGRGAMGVVYRALDERLGRHIALKLLRIDDEELDHRLAQEASLQARVDHPNVCKVFEVGRVDGRSYIAMQLIDGEPLSRAAAAMTLEQKVRVVRDVAGALHAAHRLGLIHRDVKPGNVMVEHVEGEGPRPWVLDFGLARELATPGLTMTGVVVGTPQYMAPEQASGDSAGLDRRTDVYALGATLYELLAGQPPFSGTTALDVLVKVIAADPRPLRTHQPSIPADLDAVVMRCLEKEPQRRYDSARALAEDLGRFLDGEPVQARPTSLIYRLGRKARRHRAVVATAAAALLVCIVLAGLWWHARASAVRRAELAQRFGQQVERAEGLLWRARSLPLHDIRPDHAAMRQRLTAIEAEIVGLGQAAVGPGHAAMGRGFLALDDLSAARIHLETAWAAAYRPPDVACALGLTFARLYQQDLAAIAALRSGREREQRRRAADAAYRDAALNYLRAAAGAELVPPDYVEALLAFLDGRLDESLAKARATAAATPSFYEARVLEGNVLAGLAQTEKNTGRYERAAEGWRNAAVAYRAAARVGESDPRPYAGVCTVYRWLLWQGVWRLGTASRDDLDGAVTACREALVADPDDAAVRIELSAVHTTWAEHLLGHGQDPTPDLRLAITETQLVLRGNEHNADALEELASARWQLGKYAMQQGRNAGPDLEAALTAARQAVAERPGNCGALNTFGLVGLDLAVWRGDAGSDPRVVLAEAADAFRSSTEIDPGNPTDLVNLGIAHVLHAEYQLDRLHEDPGPRTGQAIAALDRAAAVNPRMHWTYRTLGSAHLLRARHLQRTGGAPDGEARLAVTALEKSLGLNPDDATTWCYLGEARVVLALASGGATPAAAELRLARQAADRAAALTPGSGIVDKLRRSIAAATLLPTAIRPRR